MRRLIALLTSLVLVLAACGSAAPTTPPESSPPATSGAPAASATTGAAGGIVTVGLAEEPANLNPYLAIQTASRLVRELTLEGLLNASPEGNYIPQLAAEVPTVENGGISADGLTITYKLRTGVVWSDGHPFTSRDVQFTWQAIMDPGNAVNSQTGYEKIASVETPDDQTAVVRFKALYAPALSLFSLDGAVLPAHVLEGQNMAAASFNRTPEGTGPFVVTQWTSGDSIVLDRNKNFRDAGKPILDQIVFLIIPSNEVGIARLRTGDIDALWGLGESQIPQLQGVQDVKLVVTPSSNVEYLGLNLSQRGTADPAKPHPILGDRRVREAIASAIDRKPIVNDLLYGMTVAATSPIGLGWAAPEGLSMPSYDPAKAKSLLDAAGWTDANGDGVREKNGQPLRLDISTVAGSQVQELSEQIVQSQLRAVGIDLVINNLPSATLFGNWQENGTIKRGNFDILEDTWGADLDPDAFFSALFASDQIPTAANGGAGWNFFRLQDPALDKAIADGRSSLDQASRKEAYRRAVQRILDALVYIPLFNRATVEAYRTTVAGQVQNPWDAFTWNAADWTRQ
ncbi:MAG: peptide ABC transporter substrate-binding protein [Chloroflexi bacterium]|nr:peptide ABC transporter substrate-binding protein [Chloroflexota bacterium]